MGFWDNYTDINAEGGDYIGAAEKQVLIENGIPFEITDVKLDPHNQHGPRYVAFVNVPNPETGDEEERKLTFPSESGVESRNRMLAAMEEHFAGGGTSVRAKLEKKGRSILVRQA